MLSNLYLKYRKMYPEDEDLGVTYTEDTVFISTFQNSYEKRKTTSESHMKNANTDLF